MIRARVLTGFALLAMQHHGDPAALFGAAGIPADALATPDTPLPLARLMGLLNDAAVRLDVPDFGLQLAQKQDIGVLGVVALVAQHSDNVGHACAAIARNLPYHSPGVRLRIEDDPARAGYTQLRFEIDPGPGVAVARRQAIEMGMGVTSRVLHSLSGAAGDDWHIGFRHAAALAPERYGAYFTGGVRFEQAHDALSVPTALMAAPVATSDVLLRIAAERHVGNLIRRFPLDIAQQVEALVEQQLAAGASSLPQVAQALGLHERTLQRRLREQRIFFEDIVDKLRRIRAEEYLACPVLPLSQVAAMLGYTEQSSFSRVCKRWFGATPSVYRQRCLHAATPSQSGACTV